MWNFFNFRHSIEAPQAYTESEPISTLSSLATLSLKPVAGSSSFGRPLKLVAASSFVAPSNSSRPQALSPPQARRRLKLTSPPQARVAASSSSPLKLSSARVFHQRLLRLSAYLGAPKIVPDYPILSVDDLADQIAEVLNFFGLSAVMCMGVAAGAYILTLFAMKVLSAFPLLVLSAKVSHLADTLVTENLGKYELRNVSADQYASDIAALRNIFHDVYRGIRHKPLIIAPGGFYDANWFQEFVNKSGKSVDVVSHHIYNLGAGVDEHLIERILDPSYLDGVASTFSGLKNILQKSATKAKAWVGEAGGAYNNGHHLVSDAFVYSFWYLDQLGMSTVYDTRTYCRQSLVGGNYGLLNTSTFVPNPDYYSLLKLTDTRASNNKMTLMHYLCKVLADRSPGLLDFHLDLVSLEAATKVMIYAWLEKENYSTANC
ncbi:hypothetical protein S83_050890 [Arachis hypogaea]